MHWTKAAIVELDRQRAKHNLESDHPLVFLVEKAVEIEEGREVHAADVRVVGEEFGPEIRPYRLKSE